LWNAVERVVVSRGVLGVIVTVRMIGLSAALHYCLNDFKSRGYNPHPGSRVPLHFDQFTDA